MLDTHLTFNTNRKIITIQIIQSYTTTALIKESGLLVQSLHNFLQEKFVSTFFLQKFLEGVL